MIINRFFVSILLCTWICLAHSCNDCCYTRQTSNCCATTSCCQPCSSCTTVPCLKSCNTNCQTIPSRPSTDDTSVIIQRPVTVPQIQPSLEPSKSDTDNRVTNDNKVNSTSRIDINNTLTNTNSIHVPINITNINTNSIRVDASGGGGVVPVPGSTTPQVVVPQPNPVAPQMPKFIFFVIRQPPVMVPQQPITITQAPATVPQQPIYIPQQIPVYPSTGGCCGMQPMGCCSMQPRCSYQLCQSQCSSFC